MKFIDFTMERTLSMLLKNDLHWVAWGVIKAFLRELIFIDFETFESLELILVDINKLNAC